MLFERICEQRRSAADLLSLMSFFNPQGIPEWILRRHSKSVAKTGDKNEADSAFDEDFDTLQAYSLITVTADSDVCEMHALVQFCTRVWLSSFSDAERWRQKFIRLMAQEFPTGQFESWAKCQGLLLHIKSLYNKEPTGEESVNEWAHVLTNAAWYMRTKGIYAAAQDAAAKAVTIRERVVGRDDELMLKSVSHLASVLQAQGKYDEAEKLNRRALEGREKELGKQHPHTLTSVYSPAYLLHKRKRYEEASGLYQRACDGYKQKLGTQHPTTIACLDDFQLCKKKQSRNDRRAIKVHSTRA